MPVLDLRAIACVAMAACGRIDFDDVLDKSGDGGDSIRDGDASAVDAAQALCDPAKAFGTPMPISELNVTGAYDSTLVPTADERTAYFYSDRATAGDMNLYIATRPDLATPWTFQPLAELNTVSEEKEPSLSPDGTMLLFTTNYAPSTGDDDLWVASKTGATFSAPTRLAFYNSTGTDYHGCFQPAGNTVWFSSNRTGRFQIYRASYAGTSFADDAQVVPELSTSTSSDGAAAVRADGLELYFRSDRDSGGSGALDIYVASRASTTDSWGAPTRVAEVSSTATVDTPTFISNDSCRLYLSSNRGDGQSDIYLAQKPL